MPSLKRLVMPLILPLIGGITLVATPPWQAARAHGGIESCVNSLKARGYVVTSMDIDDGQIYEFEAIRNNRKWDLKTTFSCRILLEVMDT